MIFINKKECLNDKFDLKKNSFTVLEIILSLLIIFYHCYALYYGVGAKMDFISSFIKTETLGNIIVAMFFIISGFMITNSIKRDKKCLIFLKKRVLRIFPPLILTLLITVFILAPLVSTINAMDFLKQPNYYKKYLIDNILLFRNTAYAIETVFVDNIYPYAINGSLWTIKHQFFMYLYIIPLFFIFFNKKERKNYFVYYFIILLIINILSIFGVFDSLYSSIQFHVGNYIGVLNEVSHFVKLLYYFTAGVFVNLYSDKILINKKISILFIICLLLSAKTELFKCICLVTLPYLTIKLGTFKFPYKLPNISYYIYLVAFPVQQALFFYLYKKINFNIYIVLSLVISVVIGLLYYIVFNYLPVLFQKWRKKA